MLDENFEIIEYPAPFGCTIFPRSPLRIRDLERETRTGDTFSRHACASPRLLDAGEKKKETKKKILFSFSKNLSKNYRFISETRCYSASKDWKGNGMGAQAEQGVPCRLILSIGQGCGR